MREAELDSHGFLPRRDERKRVGQTRTQETLYKAIIQGGCSSELCVRLYGERKPRIRDSREVGTFTHRLSYYKDYTICIRRNFSTTLVEAESVSVHCHLSEGSCRLLCAPPEGRAYTPHHRRHLVMRGCRGDLEVAARILDSGFCPVGTLSPVKALQPGTIAAAGWPFNGLGGLS